MTVPPAGAPAVRLGHIGTGTIAPSILAIVERGVWLRPQLAARLVATFELRFDEGYPPVILRFLGDHVEVHDGPPPHSPDLVVTASLPALVRLTAAPTRSGIPRIAALTALLRGEVAIEGRRALGRRLVQVLAIPGPQRGG